MVNARDAGNLQVSGGQKLRRTTGAEVEDSAYGTLEAKVC
jgi:hypothetical protein